LRRLAGAELQRDSEIIYYWTDRTGFPPVICFVTEGKPRLAEAGVSRPDMTLFVDVNWVKRIENSLTEDAYNGLATKA
jgi:hypothetical protein